MHQNTWFDPLPRT